MLRRAMRDEQAGAFRGCSLILRFLSNIGCEEVDRQPCVKAKLWTKPLNRLRNDSMIRDPHGPAIVPLVNVTKT